MANLLTHGLLAASSMALVNPLLGLEPVSWTIFLAAIAGMLMNLDCGSCRSFGGSPLCHSLTGAVFITYLAFTIAYLAYVFGGLELQQSLLFALAVGIGAFAHLLAEIITGQQVMVFPQGIDVARWFRAYDDKASCFWGCWSRARLENRTLQDAHVNGISIATILLAIGLF